MMINYMYLKWQMVNGAHLYSTFKHLYNMPPSYHQHVKARREGRGNPW